MKLNHPLADTIALLEKATERGGMLAELGTGFYDLDAATHGIKPGELIVIGSRPTMGKTMFALNIALHAALSNKDKAVLFFSMEMPKESIYIRLLSSLGRINNTSIRASKLDENDWARFGSAVAQLIETKFLVIDKPSLTVEDIEASLLKQLEVSNNGLVIIDYIQLMGLDCDTTTRNEDLAKILRALKRIAREQCIPVIVLSQLNRELEKRPNKRPVMSDLRDSGAIEEIADLILFVYRDEVYYEDSPDKGVAEIIVGKQRNGTTGILRLRFEPQYCQFSNLAPDYYQG